MSDDRDALVSPGHRLPDLALPAAPEGTPHPLRSRGRRAPVLVLAHDAGCAPCRGYLAELAAAHAALLEWDGRVLAVVPGPLRDAARLQREMAPPFAVLADPERKLAAALRLEPPALLVADQWGELHAAWAAGAEHRWPSPDEVAGWLRWLAVQCPECEGEAL